MSELKGDMAANVVDPQVRQFVSRVSSEFARRGPFDQLDHVEARRIAEAVRAPWSEGGPVMASTTERLIEFNDGAVRVRIYAPTPRASGETRPALVYMHGGGWTIFSLDTHDRVMREFAGRSGLTVIGVDYALSPEAKFPAALGQVVGVVRWLAEQGAEVGVDAGRLALGGDSAGANLAISAALKLRDEGRPEAVKGLLLNYGGYSPHCSNEARRRFGGEGFMLTGEEVEQFWDNYLGSAADARDPLACPLIARLEGLPPTLLVIAECDVLCEQNLEMARRLAQAGVEVTSEVYRGATHSFLEAVSISDLADRAFADGSRWLARTMA